MSSEESILGMFENFQISSFSEHALKMYEVNFFRDVDSKQ